MKKLLFNVLAATTLFCGQAMADETASSAQQLTRNGSLTAASASDSVYTVTVNTAGTFGQMVLQQVENWSDIAELTVIGSLNEADMAYFARMQNMRKLDLSQTDITSVGGCSGLETLNTVVLPNTTTKILYSAFHGCTSLASIALTNITEIDSWAFTDCQSLPSALSLPNVITIGDYAFLRCANIESIDLPKVEEIGDYAFSLGLYNGAASLTTINLENVKSLGEHAFSNCTKLQAAIIPNCTYLGEQVFSGCTSLSTVTLSDELEHIAYRTFYRCSSLKDITLPSSLKTINGCAFEGARLTSIDIPEGVTLIGYRAFEGCPLESINLPSTLESIGENAFPSSKSTYNSSTGNYDYTYYLKDVYCKGVVPLATTAFNNDMAKGATLHVPAFSVSAYKLDDNWYMFGKVEALDGNLTDVTINNNFSIIDYTGLADKANLTLSSSSRSGTAGHLTVSGNSTLSLGTFTQNQNFKYSYDYDDEGNYRRVYSYPYCTTLIANNDMRADNVTTHIQMPTYQWTFLSLPYDVNVADIQVPDSTMWVVRKYNGANRAAMSGDTWENVESGQTLNAGEGYIFHCVSNDEENNDYVEFVFPAVNNSNKNNVFAYEDVTKTLNEYAAEFSHNRSWNLIGNPYPTYYNSQNIDFNAPITVWNGSGYTAYSLADDDYVLRPNEAFFVQCPINSTSITFPKEGRQHQYSTTVSSDAKSMTRMAATSNRQILNFVVSNNEYSDRARLVLNESAKVDYEMECDASKFMSSNNDVPQVYIIDNGVNYAIDERPTGAGSFALGVRFGQEGEYTFALTTKNYDGDVLLTDDETGQTVNIAKEQYTFSAQAKTYTNRFTVNINGGDITAIQNVANSDNMFKLDGNVLTFHAQSGNVSVVSADGKTIYKGVPTSAIVLQQGVYVIHTEKSTSKIAVK